MAESHSWELSARAQRELDALPEGVAGAVLELVTGPIAGNPYRLGGPLRDRWSGYLSARRGEFRVIYEVLDDRRLVRVVHIGHRGRVYGQ